NDSLWGVGRQQMTTGAALHLAEHTEVGRVGELREGALIGVRAPSCPADDGRALLFVLSIGRTGSAGGECQRPDGSRRGQRVTLDAVAGRHRLTEDLQDPAGAAVLLTQASREVEPGS